MIDYLQRSIYFNLIYENRWELVVTGIGITLLLTLASFFAGTLIGMLLCWGKRNGTRAVRGLCQGFIRLMNQLPPLVLLMLFAYFILVNSGLDSMVIAIITFTLKSGAGLAELFGSAVESVEKGEQEAARTLGLGRWQTFRYIVLPQAIHQVMPLYKTQFVRTMQDTSVVSLLAIPDLTRSVTIISSRTMDPVITLLITTVVYLLIGALAGPLLGLADRKF